MFDCHELWDLGFIETLTLGRNRGGMLQGNLEIVGTYCSFFRLREGPNHNVGLDRLICDLGLHFSLKLVRKRLYKLGSENLVYAGAATEALILAFHHVSITCCKPVAASTVLGTSAMGAIGPGP